MKMKFNIPDELEYFSFDEIANQWGCEVSDIERLVFEDKSLRAAIVTDLCEDFYGLGEPEWWRFVLTHRQKVEGSRSSVENKDSRIDSSQHQHDVLRGYVKGKWWIGRDFLPLSQLPQFLYLDISNSTQNRGTKIFEPFEEVRFERGDTFDMNSVLSFDGNHIDIFYSVEGDEDAVSGMFLIGKDFVIPREERDRYMSGRSVSEKVNEPKQTKVVDTGKVEDEPLDPRTRNNLLRIIKAMTMELDKSNEGKFTKDGIVDYLKLSNHLEEFVTQSLIPTSEIEATISGCFNNYDIEVTERSHDSGLV
jgi:hypothetical protein